MCPLLENAFNSILRKSVLCLIGQGCDTYIYFLQYNNIILSLSTELPKPQLGDLYDLKASSVRLRRERTPNVLCMDYKELSDIDVVKLELVPEKKGIILKHVEYEVTSKVIKV